MSHGFYQLLGVSDSSSPAEVEAAYQKELAGLVRRMRHARQQGADVRILEARERDLRDARAVLMDPLRRRRYDAFRKASDQGLPTDAEGLWRQAVEALVDPVAVSALRVVRTLTDLPVGDPFPGVSEPPAPPPPAIRMVPPSLVADEPGRGSWPGMPANADAAAGGTGPTPAEVSLLPDETSPGLGVVTIDTGRLYDPLEELLADLSGTDAGIRPSNEPIDPIDRLARDFGYDGRFLQAVRESRGFSVDDLATATRISGRYLQAIEANGYDQLPAATFVRGYLKEIVRVLALGERDVVGGYMTLFHRQRG